MWPIFRNELIDSTHCISFASELPCLSIFYSSICAVFRLILTMTPFVLVVFIFLPEHGPD